MSTSNLVRSFGTKFSDVQKYRAARKNFFFQHLKPIRKHLQTVHCLQSIKTCLENNRAWIADKLDKDPEYFARWQAGQSPEFIWIGCSDAHIVPCDIIGKASGDVFLHRNVGNIVSLSDPNCMSVLEYGIRSLEAKHVIVCGHYGCDAVKAAMTLPPETIGFVNGWISGIRAVRDKWSKQLSLVPESKRVNILCELNTLEQTRNVCKSYPVQNAWKHGKEVYVYALIYDAGTGLLRMLAPAIESSKEILTIDVALECITRSLCTSNLDANLLAHSAIP